MILLGGSFVERCRPLVASASIQKEAWSEDEISLATLKVSKESRPTYWPSYASVPGHITGKPLRHRATPDLTPLIDDPAVEDGHDDVDV